MRAFLAGALLAIAYGAAPPAVTCPAGQMALRGVCTIKPATVIDTWLKAHNVLRCVHGSPPVTWNAAAAASAQTWANGLTTLTHSKSYLEAPPAGPGGENLAMGYATPEDSTVGWYSEIDSCASLPGCTSSANPSVEVGHFTAMVWKGVTEIGCGTNAATKIDVCRYRSGDTLSSNTANMQGYYPQNVLAPVTTVQACVTQFDSGNSTSAGNSTSPTAAPSVVSTPAPSAVVKASAGEAAASPSLVVLALLLGLLKKV